MRVTSAFGNKYVFDLVILYAYVYMRKLLFHIVIDIEHYRRIKSYLFG